MALVFQYGSNTSASRLNGPERLGGAAKPLSLARTTKHFDIAFTHVSRSGYGVADLIPGARQVYGVLYAIPDDRVFRNLGAPGVITLDRIEGEGISYRRITVDVERIDNGDVVTALTYVVLSRRQGVETAAEYVKHIVDGLRSAAAPAEYVTYVKARAADHCPSQAVDINAL